VELDTRRKKYKEIEALRGRPLIVYATSTRPNAGGSIAGDAVREFIDQIDAIPQPTSEVDVLIHSTGGDALTAWKLMSVLRERFTSVRVLVPSMAFSAATLFALGADEIVMHPHASLGPIDPQIGMQLPDGKQRAFAFEDVGAFLRFIGEEIGITEQRHTSGVVDRLFSVVDPLTVGAAKRASELSTDVGERLLRMHMTSPEDVARARAIAEGLNKSFFAHGDAVSRSRARELQLRVASPNPELEKLIWDAYLGMEAYMELRAQFDPLQFFLANGGDRDVRGVGPITLPENAPPELVQAVWNQAAQAALARMSAQAPVAVEYHLVNAVVESTRIASEFRTVGELSGGRLPNGEIQLRALVRESGWRVIGPEVGESAGPGTSVA
jgi:ClpP class serine protease